MGTAAENLKGDRRIHSARAVLDKELVLVFGIRDSPQRSAEADANAVGRFVPRPRKSGIIQREQGAGHGELRESIEALEPVWRKERGRIPIQISPALQALNIEVSKAVTRPIPLRLAVMDSHSAALPTPQHVMGPTPVMTTRRREEPDECEVGESVMDDAHQPISHFTPTFAFAFDQGFESIQRLGRDILDEKTTDHRLAQPAESRDTKAQIVNDFDAGSVAGWRKCPNDSHPFCPRAQVLEAQFHAGRIRLIGAQPGDGQAAAARAHLHEIAPARLLPGESNETVMR
jgi:hypothetical protein